MTRFSIVIPAHNEENYIQNTINSIKNQHFKDYEIIVVANGCSDKTEEIVKRNKNVKLFSSKIAHVSRARNYGAGKAKGELLLFLDADTHLTENSLEDMHQQFTDKYAIATAKVKPDEKKLKYQFAMGFKNWHNTWRVYNGHAGCLLCRKEHFNKVNGYNPNIVIKEHRELTNRLKQYGKYKCLNTYVITSMRRFRQWGLGKSAGFWIKNWWKNLVSDIKDEGYEKIR